MIALGIFIGLIACLQVVSIAVCLFLYYQIRELCKTQDAIFNTCLKTEDYFEVMQVNESIIAGEN